MKLDKSVVNKILKIAYGCNQVGAPYEDFLKEIQNLDLVFKPGDASQSTLVENRTKNTNIEKL